MNLEHWTDDSNPSPKHFFDIMKRKTNRDHKRTVCQKIGPAPTCHSWDPGARELQQFPILIGNAEIFFPKYYTLQTWPEPATSLCSKACCGKIS